MEDNELMQLWKENDRKLEEARILNLQAWALHYQTRKYLQAHKAKTRLDSLVRFKTGAVILGIAWVLLLLTLVAGNHGRNWYFTLSLSSIAAFNILAIAVYLYQIISIRRIDYGQPVTEVQKRIAALQASTIRITRILFLQTPFYCTWFWHPSWIHYDSASFWLISFPITLFFILLSVWLFRNISLRNTGKRWFRILMGTKEWTALVQAKEDLHEIEDFQENG